MSKEGLKTASGIESRGMREVRFSRRKLGIHYNKREEGAPGAEKQQTALQSQIHYFWL